VGLEGWVLGLGFGLAFGTGLGLEWVTMHPRAGGHVPCTCHAQAMHMPCTHDMT
jgi:hypothetical protein